MISIIIPTRDEEASLRETIAALRQTSAPHEIIVVDASSGGETWRAASQLGLELFASEVAQRAAQMNLGAQKAGGDILLFLHADTILPPGALELIQSSLAETRIGGGAFARRFRSPSITLKITGLLSEFRNRALGWHLGDQAMFVRRDLFEQLGGFRAFDRFEDLDFSRRLRRITRLATLRPPVWSSARRFEKSGPFRQTARDFALTIRYLTGSSAVLHSSNVVGMTNQSDEV